jgi:hypothetical protein
MTLFQLCLFSVRLVNMNGKIDLSRRRSEITFLSTQKYLS